MGGVTPTPITTCAPAVGASARSVSNVVVPAKIRLLFVNFFAQGATLLNCHILLSSGTSTCDQKLYFQYQALAHR